MLPDVLRMHASGMMVATLDLLLKGRVSKGLALWQGRGIVQVHASGMTSLVLRPTVSTVVSRIKCQPACKPGFVWR